MNIFEKANRWVEDNEHEFLQRLFPHTEMIEANRFQDCVSCHARQSMGVQGCFKANCDYAGPMTPVFFAAHIMGNRPLDAAKWITGETKRIDEDPITRMRRRTSQLRNWKPDKKKEMQRVEMPSECVKISGPASDYLIERGVDTESVREFGIKWCKTGMWRNRIILPVSDIDGKQIFFIGRAIFDDMQPKYRYPVGSSKSLVLYGAPKGDEVTLVEGPFDSIAWTQRGVPTASILGSVLSPRQLQIVVRNYSRVTTAFDGDDAGYACTRDVIERCSPYVDELHAIELYEGMDPADCDPHEFLPGRKIKKPNDIRGVQRRTYRIKKRSIEYA